MAKGRERRVSVRESFIRGDFRDDFWVQGARLEAMAGAIKWKECGFQVGREFGVVFGKEEAFRRGGKQ